MRFDRIAIGYQSSAARIAGCANLSPCAPITSEHRASCRSTVSTSSKRHKLRSATNVLSPLSCTTP
eukprot:5154270-Amphidinium_carterae.1